MAREMVKSGPDAVAVKSAGALKKAAKKAAGKKAAGKKAAGKKAAGKKAAGKKAAGKKVPAKKAKAGMAGGYHHLQRAAAVISLLEGESGGDLRMLLEEGVRRYRDGMASATGLLRAAEHLAMAGLYAARASHRLDVSAPDGEDVGKMLDRVGVRVDGLPESRLTGMAEELLRRAEAAEEDAHLAWELGMAAEGICEGVEAE